MCPHSNLHHVGHQFLVEDLGILHRDISETNIVLRAHPEEAVRGYLMDLDMATKLTPTSDTSTNTTSRASCPFTTVRPSSRSGSKTNEGSNRDRPPKAARTVR
jgi:serine/threonine protein kinase